MGSDTITVEKNGHQDEMNKTVWDMIGGDANKDGWRRVVNEPIEVLEIKSKKSEAAKAKPSTEIESPEGEVEVQTETEEAEAPAAKPAKPMNAKEVKTKTGKKK